MAKPESVEFDHPAGEPNGAVEAGMPKSEVDTFGGKIHVFWDPNAQVTALGPLTFFIEFLKTSGLWEQWVSDCPLEYKSRNSPKKEEILATVLLSVLAGHKRYAHITALRGDSVMPRLLGVEQLRSEDSVRRAFTHASEEQLTTWMDLHLDASFAPLLAEPWILDVDATVKPLYGHQEEARVGYNPAKPGRPSHAYQAMFIASLRMVLNVDVTAGDQTAPCYARAGLWGWLDAREREQWPRLLRGDLAWGSEATMVEAESRKLAYLFKLKQSQGVRDKIAKLAQQKDWRSAGDGWQGLEGHLQLEGWTRARRILVLRRRLREKLVVEEKDSGSGQSWLSGVEPGKGKEFFEYAVLVTSLQSKDFLMISQLYRDRAEAENIFDELKNQWGWTGYTTQDLKRSQLMARIVALVFNWWSLYSRLALPDKHAEATTSRPLFLHGVARKTFHGGQTKLTITSNHGKAETVMRTLANISELLSSFRQDAEQFVQPKRWALLLRLIFKRFYERMGPNVRLPAIA